MKEKKYDISKEAIENAINLGYNSREKLCKYFNVSLSTIKRRLKKYNLSTFSRCFDENKFLDLYNKGLYDSQISKELKTSNGTISNYRNKLGLKQNFKYKSELQKEEILKCLENHTVEETSILLNLDKRLIELYKNEIIILPDYKISNIEKQVILGSLLGDGNLSLNKSGNCAHLIFAHSEKQKEYGIWKTILLKNIMYFHFSFEKVCETDKRSNKTYISYRSLSKQINVLYDYYIKWYTSNGIKCVKHINKTDLYELDALGLAVWFQDDGYNDHNTGYVLCTQCFSKEDINTICNYFKDKWEIEPKVRKTGEIYIGKEYRNLFRKIIEPYIHNDCKYKLINKSL